MSTNIINFNTATKSLNDAKFEADVLAKIHESSPKRWWLVRRKSHQFDNQQLDLIFFRDLGDVLKQIPTDQHRYKMLIPLYQYLNYIQVNDEHTDALLEGYFGDNHTALNIHNCPTSALAFIAKYPDQQQFLAPELSYESFLFSDLVPIYMINKFGELEKVKENNSVDCDLYVHFEHTEFIELVFKSFSLIVSNYYFAKDGFIQIWHQYLTLMQENAEAPNIENIHHMYWLSFCPELANLSNTAKGVN